MTQPHPISPEKTAVRVALWRAMHLQVDPPPHILSDDIGIKLLAPDAGWQKRPDMSANGTRRARASIVARARYIEDLVIEQTKHNVNQYILLGAGLDTFAQRKPQTCNDLKIFEIDQQGPQEWKRQRLIELGYGIPDNLKLVAINFEQNSDWLSQLSQAGFNLKQPAIVASTGVAMYLTLDAIKTMLKQAASLATGSTLAMSFMLPLDKIDPEEQPSRASTEKYAKLGGTPFLSFFTPPEILALAREAGFKKVEHVSSVHLAEKYFAGRVDALKPSSSEELLIATT